MTIDFIGVYFSEVASLTSLRNPLRSRRITEARARLNPGLPGAVAISTTAGLPVTKLDAVVTVCCLLTLEAQEGVRSTVRGLDAGSMRDLHATLTPSLPQNTLLKIN